MQHSPQYPYPLGPPPSPFEGQRAPPWELRLYGCLLCPLPSLATTVSPSSRRGPAWHSPTCPASPCVWHQLGTPFCMALFVALFLSHLCSVAQCCNEYTQQGSYRTQTLGAGGTQLSLYSCESLSLVMKAEGWAPATPPLALDQNLGPWLLRRAVPRGLDQRQLE